VKRKIDFANTLILMMSDIQKYFNTLNSVISQQNGSIFAREIGLFSHSDVLTQCLVKVKKTSIVQLCENSLKDQNTAKIIAFQLSAFISLIENDLEAGI
jgi:vacuolar-type H+-ATPase subunit C/Vma6